MNVTFDLLEPWASSWHFWYTASAADRITALIAGLLLLCLLALPLILLRSPARTRLGRLLQGVVVTVGLVLLILVRVSGRSRAMSELLWQFLGAGFLLLLPLVPVLLIGLTVWAYRGVPGATPRRVSIVLALRLAAFLLVILAMVRPALSFSEKDKTRSLLLIVVDSSESMTILDEFDNQSRWAFLLRNLKDAGPALQKLRDVGVDVAFYRFDDGRREFKPDEPGRADGKRTDTGLMLRSLYDDYPDGARHLLGLLILSDGADNGTRYPALTEAERWRRRQQPCPIHTFAFGKPTTRDVQKDVAIRELRVPQTGVPIKSELRLGVRVDAPGFQDATARLRLFLDDVEVKAQDVVLRQEEGNLFEIKANAPARAGEVKVTVRLEDPDRPGEPLPGQVSKLHNEMTTFMTVTKEGLSVLLVDKPRAFEPQAICDALTSTTRIRLYPVWLRGDQADASAGDLFQFDKQQYDVIILGDVTARQLQAVRPDALEAIAKQVDRGAGLLMLGGYANFGNGDWGGTPLEGLSPVSLTQTGQIEGKVRMVPTETGLRRYGYVLRLKENDKDSAATWQKLPPLNGATRLGRLKPNVASVLAQTDKGDPLLVTRDYGSGRVLAFGGDTTELWTRSDEEGFKAHREFWKRLVIWLAHQENTDSSAWVKPGTRRLPLHTDLNFTMGLLSKGEVPIRGAQYVVEVIGPGDERISVTPSRIGSADGGIFKKADKPGVYRIVVYARGKGPDGEEAKGDAAARFLVYDEDLELTRRAADHEFLRKLATVGGGQFLRAEKLSEFLEQLETQPRDPSRTRGEVWPDWKTEEFSPFLIGYFVLFVGLICGEWFLRRRWGLV